MFGKKEESNELVPTPEQRLAFIRRVGVDKPLGWLTLNDIIKNCRTDPEILRQEAEIKGLATRNLISFKSDVLVVFHREALARLLEKNRVVLTRSKWSVDPDVFIHRVLNTVVSGHTELFDVVADTFGDIDDVRRLHFPDIKWPN